MPGEKLEIGDKRKVFGIAGDKRETKIDGCCCNKSVEEFEVFRKKVIFYQFQGTG